LVLEVGVFVGDDLELLIEEFLVDGEFFFELVSHSVVVLFPAFVVLVESVDDFELLQLVGL